jgi:WD40-like Beta Propeller Repeat
MRVRVLLATSVLAAALLAAAPPAGADVFKSIAMASNGFLEGGEGELQQALYAHDPAISGNGEYVAFDGYYAGLAGVWRRDLLTGEVRPVAVGAELPGSETCVAEESSHEPCDAELPSISENGQYVSFTTTAQLAPHDDTNSGPDVYVRNMDIPESQSCQAAEEEDAPQLAQRCAFTLVSAVNGEDRGLEYEDALPSEYGAVASGRSAISANGQEVAFVTTAVSNLAGPKTPALQVAVRNLATEETQLVSTEYDPSTGQAIPDAPASATEDSTVYGAVYSPGGASNPPTFPFNDRAYGLTPAVGASISADGTTVAWMGQTVYKQSRMLSGEREPRYSEPLWRRIADGPLAATRRVTGGSEPESPACIASGQTQLPGLGAESLSSPCQGPFAVEPEDGVWAGTVGDSIPQLSADGYTVAFLATAQLVSLGVDFGRSAEGEADDLYVADMHEGLSRGEALRPLTELASGKEQKVAPDGAILDVGVSPDGSQVAFTTQRTEFPLNSLTYVSQPAAVPGMAELFDVDLADDTLTRVTRGYEGGPSERPHPEAKSGVEDQYEIRTDGALSPSFSDDGDILAFSSTASNLVYGDGNTPSQPPIGGSADGSDAFFVAREVFSPEPAETYVSTPPVGPLAAPEWRLGVTALSLANGSVRLYVEVPGAGSLSATAEGAVETAVAPHAAHAGARRGRSSAKRASARASVAERGVATAKEAIAAGEGGLVQLTLTLAPGYRTLATRSGGLSGTASVVFTAPGRPTLRQSIAVSFLSRAKSSRAKASRTAKRAASKARRGR